MSYNKVIIMGNMTKDPELKYTEGGLAICNFSIATNRRWKGKDGEKKEEVEFHNCVAFNKQAEVIAQFFTKGKGIHVDGRLHTRSWETPEGQKRYATEIVMEEFSFIPSGKRDDNAGPPAADDIPF
jgi:single-strand DNA-binding protein